MSWHFSRELAAAYSAGTCSAGDASVQSSSTTTQDESLWLGKTTDACRLSRYGTTLELLTADHGAELLTSYLAVFPVRTSAQQDEAQESKASVRGSGWKWHGSLAMYDHGSRSWKTRQCSLLEGLDVFWETFPRWGMMRDGELCRLKMPALHTAEKGFGFLPTPVKYDATPGGPNNHYNGLGHMAKTARFPTPTATANMMCPSMQKWPSHRNLLPTPVKSDHASRRKTENWNGNDLVSVITELEESQGNQQAQAGGKLNPTWVEWLMGWPIGWTDLRPLATGRFRQWSGQHGSF